MSNMASRSGQQNWPKALPANCTLQLWANANYTELLFASDQKWLHPLFALAEFLASQPKLDRPATVLHDRVTGKEAAFLTIQLGVGSLYSEVLSERAAAVLDARGLPYYAAMRVPRIACQTEDLLEQVSATDEAMAIIRQRQSLAQAARRPAIS